MAHEDVAAGAAQACRVGSLCCSAGRSSIAGRPSWWRSNTLRGSTPLVMRRAERG